MVVLATRTYGSPVSVLVQRTRLYFLSCLCSSALFFVHLQGYYWVAAVVCAETESWLAPLPHKSYFAETFKFQSLYDAEDPSNH